MRWVSIFSLILFLACNNQPEEADTTSRQDSAARIDKTIVEDNLPVDTLARDNSEKTYSNQRFKEVRVLNTGQNQFLVQGKGQIFEASFNWIVEDGHEEIKKGYATTDAGAPEWGNFKFNLEVEKKRPNSKLTLVLFESSAKDGSRQYELPIPLN